MRMLRRNLTYIHTYIHTHMQERSLRENAERNGKLEDNEYIYTPNTVCVYVCMYVCEFFSTENA